MIPTLKSSKFHPPQWNQVHFDHPRKNEVKFDAHTKTKWFSSSIQKPNQLRPPTQKRSRSIPTLKTRHFRPTHKTHVNFDPHAKNASQFWSINRNQVIFDQHTIPKSILTPHKKQVKFDPDAKTMSISIPHVKIKLVSIPSLKSSQVDPHSNIKSISMPRHKTQVISIRKNKWFSTATRKRN